MKKNVLIGMCLSLLVVTSCAKKNADKTMVDDVKVAEQMLADGYKMGTVVEFPDLDSPCTYQIRLNEETILEVGSLDFEFQKDGLEVWVSFLAQRRMSVCGRALPVEIRSIKKK